MATDKLPQYINMRQLRKHVIGWSDDKIRRLIADHSFPAMKDPAGQYLFDTQQVLDWLKRRTVKAG